MYIKMEQSKACQEQLLPVGEGEWCSVRAGACQHCLVSSCLITRECGWCSVRAGACKHCLVWSRLVLSGHKNQSTGTTID